MTVTLPLPYRRSRALAPGNDLLGTSGVALDVVGLDVCTELEAGWRRRVEHAASAIGWPTPSFARRNDARGETLAFTAPGNQLRTACTANEWALCAALVELDPCHWGSLWDRTSGSAGTALEYPCVAGPHDATFDKLVGLGAAEARAHRTG